MYRIVLDWHCSWQPHCAMSAGTRRTWQRTANCRVNFSGTLLSLRSRRLDLRSSRRLARSDWLSARVVACRRNRRLLAGHQTLSGEVDQTRLELLPSGVREDALERHRAGIPARDRRDCRWLESQGGRGRPLGLGRLNANQELPYYYVPWLDKKEGKPPITHAPGNCSAFIASGSHTKDGRIVMGHNAWTNYVVGTRWNVVFDIKPTGCDRASAADFSRFPMVFDADLA